MRARRDPVVDPDVAVGRPRTNRVRKTDSSATGGRRPIIGVAAEVDPGSGRIEEGDLPGPHGAPERHVGAGGSATDRRPPQPRPSARRGMQPADAASVRRGDLTQIRSARDAQQGVRVVSWRRMASAVPRSRTCREPYLSESGACRGSDVRPRGNGTARRRGAGSERIGCAQALISLRSSPPVMAILRGLACSATGIRSVSTPAS